MITPAELGVAQSLCKAKGRLTKAGTEWIEATVGNRKVPTVKGVGESEKALSKMSR